MSDDESYLRDLEGVGASLPPIPDTYQQLRGLLAALPSGTQPDVRAGRAGTTETDPSGTGGLATQQLTIESNVPIGTQPGSVIGRVSELFYGQSNLLQDPTLEENAGNGAILGAAITTISPSWGGHRVVNSGTAPGGSGVFVQESYERVGSGATAGVNPFDSSQWKEVFSATANTYDIDSYVYNFTALDLVDTEAPYLICSVRLNVLESGTADVTTFTTQLVYMELWNETTAAVLATSLPYSVSQSAFTKRLWVSWPVNHATLQGGNTLRWRLRFHVVKATATNSSITLAFGEPTLHFSSTELPNPYSPILGKWQPSLLRVSRDDDTQYRLVIGADVTTPTLQWGSGAAAADLGIYRGGAKVLGIDDNASGRASIDMTAGTGPGTPGAGKGRLYFSSADKLYHSVDDAGVDTALGGGGGATQVSRSAVSGAADYVARIKIAADTTYRATLGLSAADVAELAMGAGGVAAADVRLIRATAGGMQVDTIGTANSARLLLRATAGQRAFFDVAVTGDTVERILIGGDATLTGITMSSGAAAADVRARRSAAKTVLVDDAAGGNLTLVNFLTASLQRAGTEVSLVGHGLGDHVDITRKFWLAAEDATLDGATFASLGASPDQTRVVAYADAATSGASWVFGIPSDYTSGNITVLPVWSPGATDAVAHTVRWSFVAKSIGNGSTVTAAGTTVTFTGASAARTVGVVVYDTETSTTVAPSGATNPFRVEVRRIGADAADTYVGVVNLIGLIVGYVANQ